MKEVVITGVNGFIGSALAKKLLLSGIKVYGVDIQTDKFEQFEKYDSFVPIYADFSKYTELKNLIPKNEVDVFYHFAWAGGFTSAIRDYKLQLSNAGYAGDALMAAHDLGAKKYVYANTYNQYEIQNFLCSETFEPRYTCIYSAGKTAASLVCRTLAYNLGLDYCAGLIPMPYGKNNYSMQLVNIVIRRLLDGESPKLVEGNNLYDLVYIEDIADAFIALGEKGISNKEYYIGHRTLKTFKELMMEIRDYISPNTPLGFGEYQDNQQIDYNTINLNALYEDTGFECKADFKKTIIETAEWIKENIK